MRKQSSNSEFYEALARELIDRFRKQLQHGIVEERKTLISKKGKNVVVGNGLEVEFLHGRRDEKG